MNHFELAKKYFLEGCLFLDARDFSRAESRFSESLELLPDRASTLTNLSVALLKLGKYPEAKDAAEKAISLESGNSEAFMNLGLIEKELKSLESAIKFFDKAISHNSQYFEAWSNKGNVLNELKRYEEAVAHYDQALNLNPDYADAWSNKGLTLNKLKRYDEAIFHYDKAVNIRPQYHEAWTNKGVTLLELKRYDEAIFHFDQALNLNPDYADALFNKGIALNGIARGSDARICFEKAIKQQPDFHKARWARLFTFIPVIAIGDENFDELRAIFSSELDLLKVFFLSESLEEAYEVIGFVQPFYLAYQELNNKQLLNQYGQLCCCLMQGWQNSYKLLCDIKKENKKIKLGIVSEQIRNHSVWHAITRGLIFNLDTTKFEIHIFHLGDIVDDETLSARNKVTTFTSNCSSLLDWASSIVEKNIDVLLYPEIGMSSLATQLACLRLAPTQIASWGHPETTGLPTIDYYLSAELFESESSQDAYTETLVKLPNLGCHYSRLPVVSAKFDFEGFGIDRNEPIMVCPGMPYKYAPKYDWIFAEIAKRLGKGKLIFFNYENGFSNILRLRLEGVFNEAGLILDDYVVFIPWLKPAQFYGLMEFADVYLDTIGFSGFNSAMQAVDCALPIVTRECNFMRGRLASGVLKKMTIPELVVKTDEAYIELVIRLAQDSSYRNQIKAKMIQMRDVLYEDIEPIHAFEQFLLNKASHSI